MVNIEERSGLNFSLGEKKLIYDKEIFPEAGDWVKDFEFAKYAYKNPAETGIKNPAYFGVRYLEKSSDLELLKKFKYEYDVTAFEVSKIGEEYLKTVGHYHGHVPGLSVAYPEVYEVIDGNIEYLLQSEVDKDGDVEVIWVFTGVGDKIVMPPNYGHVSMNVGNTPAIESNIQLRDLPKTSDYTPYKERVGGPLYRKENNFEKNPNYKIKSLRFAKPKEKADWGLTKNKPLYTSMIEMPEKFQWITEPQNFEFKFEELFEEIESPFPIR